MSHRSRSLGFTLLELLVVMGITTILLGFVTINLLKIQHNTSVSGASDTLIADMKSQQMKAMSGASSDNLGIHFTSSNSYILFHGTYADDSTRFTVSLDDPISILNSPGNEIIFSKLSGEVAGAPYTITIKNTAGVEQQTLTVNQYGVIRD